MGQRLPPPVPPRDSRMVPAPSVAVQAPSSRTVDLNALYSQKCDSALWKGSIFCSLGSGSRAGEMISGMRIVPGSDGQYIQLNPDGSSTSMAWTFYKLFKMVKDIVESGGLLASGIRYLPAYKRYLFELDQLYSRIEAGAPISFESLDSLAEMLYSYMQYPIIANRVKAYLRDTSNIAVYDMPTYVIPAPSPTQSWGQWFRGLFG